jgi:hypothetical protein
MLHNAHGDSPAPRKGRAAKSQREVRHVDNLHHLDGS